MVGHLVGDVDRWVQRVELEVELLEIELLTLILQLGDGVALLVLRVLLVSVLLGVLVFFLLVFLRTHTDIQI